MSRFNCTACKAYKKCQGPIAAERCGSGPVDLLILGEAPGKEEEVQARPFIGKSGQLLRNTLRGITESYVLANSRSCYADHKPKPAELENCKRNWIKAIARYKPKLIVALGDYAHTVLSGKKAKMKEVVGGIGNFRYKDLNIVFITNYHPAYMLRVGEANTKTSEKAETLWLDTWDKISDFLENGLPDLPKIRLLTDANQICYYLRLFRKEYGYEYAYDYETWGDVNALRPELCNEFKILCVGLSTRSDTVAFPLGHPVTGEYWNYSKVSEEWQAFLSVSDGEAIAQNAKYEHRCNLKVFGQTYPLSDTMLQMNLVEEMAEANLEAIMNYCKIPWAWYKKQMQSIQKNPLEVELEELLTYCGLDALGTRISHGVLQEEIEKQELMDALHLTQITARHLAHVEMMGMSIDGAVMSSVTPELKKEAKSSKEKFRNYKSVQRAEAWASENIKNWPTTNQQFNPNSHPQMMHFCLDQLHLPVQPKWDGSYSFAKKVLEKFEERYPVIKSLLKYRSIESILKNFVSKWREFTGPDNCIHTNYNQDVAQTGRLSSSEINLQNLPKDNISRKALNSRYKNGLLLSSDYVQLEPMLLAGLSDELELKQAFANNLDLHIYVASQIYGIEYDELVALYNTGDEDAKKKRFHGKQMNLGTMYGITKYGLSDYTGLSLDAAQELIDSYNRKFPGVYDYRTELCKKAIRDGYVCDLFGRRRHLPDARSSNKGKQNRALRQAGNAPIQSTGNSFCLFSLCLTREMFRERNIRAVVINTEHDKLQIDLDADWRQDVIDTVTEAMLIHNEMDYWQDKGVKLKVDVSVGKNLYEMESI